MTKDEEAIALRVAKELIPTEGVGNWYVDFASRFLAELRKTQEPVAWINDKLPHMTVRIKPHEGGNWVPVFHHPVPIPEGMVLVPRELTIEMYEACCCSMDRGYAFEYVRAAYKAMIAAALEGKR